MLYPHVTCATDTNNVTNVTVENETYIVASENDVLGIIKQKEDNE